MDILCGVPEEGWSSWILAKQRRQELCRDLIQGFFFFPKQNKNILWKRWRLLQKEIKVSNLGLVGAKPVSSSSGWGARVRRGKCLALEEKNLRQRRNQMWNNFWNPEGRFRSPLHGSCLQRYLPEITQNDSSGPCCSSPPLELPSILLLWASTIQGTPRTTTPLEKSLSIRRKTGHPCFRYLFSSLKEQEIWAVCFIHCIFCYSSILENSL